MKSKLREYFPMIRTRQEIMDDINSRENLKDVYTIVLFEKSPRAFHAFKNLYRHSAGKSKI